MNKFCFLTVLIFIPHLGYSQTRTVQYSYDAAGNRIMQEEPHDNDGIVFENREKFLPVKKNPNYYTEYVHRWPNTETTKAGTYRIVTGKHGEWYYTTDHYETFIRFKP